jgi:nicotinamide-nucleotide amidase
MAEGVLARARADLAVSITGIAGPGGGSADKPVGLVCFGLAGDGRETATQVRRFPDTGREEIRLVSVRTALEMLLERLRKR